MTAPYKLIAKAPAFELHLLFAFAGDRFGHTIERRPRDDQASRDQASRDPAIANEATVLVSAVDGTPDDDWPASPAFQEISLESIGGSLVALATGQAGCSYWSASVSVLNAETSDAAAGFEFDVAVRTKLPAPFLGSTYRCPFENAPFNSEASSESSSAATIPSVPGQAPPTTLTIVVSTGYGEGLSDSGFSVRPNLPRESGSQSLITLRWKYSIACR